MTAAVASLFPLECRGIAHTGIASEEQAVMAEFH